MNSSSDNQLSIRLNLLLGVLNLGLIIAIVAVFLLFNYDDGIQIKITVITISWSFLLIQNITAIDLIHKLLKQPKKVDKHK